ncbi:efflux RND transporter permease subunit [Desulfotalea psychrophila]|uniref:Related to multidrug-efflux transport protein n=1 Tax=Desulfotalea psychrophila (strain LSv54 / DSM 12343) TaxID=177439 RepID=Q6ALC4_DESPS|nr:efflux RND transporter permease subunit [Desulfotalea psychrophila]CAG36851.1 related to multidrug-efflux transport protein [Desulfotalea psychrophila LSv54]
MKISEISVRRPVLATVMSLLIVLIGLVAYDRLTVREYPNIDEPTVSVVTVYQGASPEIIETEITTIIEDSLSGIEGIKTISSESLQERSQISIVFKMERNADDAAAEVRDRVGRVRADLPLDVEEPVIAKVEADADPILYMAFSSDKHSNEEITDYVDRYVTDQIEMIDGVAEAQVLGARKYSMRIWLDPALLTGHGVTPQDVEEAIRAQNIEVPGGRLESSTREFTVLSDTSLNSTEEFENIIVRKSGTTLVRLKDIGRAEIGPQSVRSSLRYNGAQAVALGLVKQSVANPLDISIALHKMLPELKASLPEGMKTKIVYDSSIFIERSIENVFSSIFEAVALVLLIIFIFLRSVRSTLIPLVTIPVSLIGSFVLMWAFGFSINTLTLLAMVLAVGLVVDDAIVVLENVHRHVEKGLKPAEAAIKGMREIGFAVVLMTMTLAAVFVPVAMMEGRTGKLFTEFALTLAGAVIVSGFVALTLTPMMCAKMLRHQDKHMKIFTIMENIFIAIEQGYKRVLAWSLKTVIFGLTIAVLAGAGSYYLLQQLPSEMSPLEDRGVFMTFAIAPDGANLKYSDHYLRQTEKLLQPIPESNGVFSVAGMGGKVTEAISFVQLKDWADRQRSSLQIAGELAPSLFGIPGVLCFPITPPSLGQPFMDQPVQFVIKTSESYVELNKQINQLMAEVRKNPKIIAARTDLKLNSPELRLQIDRDKAADLGVNIAVIGRTIETMMGGREVTRFKMDGEQYDVIVKIEDKLRVVPEDLNQIHVRSASGIMIPLANLVSIEEGVTAQSLNHFNRSRAAVLSANLAPGYSQGEALAFLSDAAKRILPKTARIDYKGQSREFMESNSGLIMTFALALIMIYLMMAAQFESFVDPLIILFTVPLSMVGALLALYCTGNSLSIYSQVGLITLVGLITKHGILIVEFANQLQEQGKSKLEAVLEAATLRLRPILMTTGAMVLGSVPLALASGAGAESRSQIGWVIVGGLTLGTALTLFVVPSVYMLLAKKRQPLEPEAEK